MASPKFPQQQLQDRVSEKPSANGVAIIIANEYHADAKHKLKPLSGPSKDAEMLKSTFTSLNISCYVKINVTARELVGIVNEITSTTYPDSYNRIIFVYSGHGTIDRLLMQDGNPISIEKDIIRPCEPLRAHKLALIPKIFLFDTCRGNDETKGTLVPRGGNDLPSIKVPEFSNMLIAYSTLQGKKAYEFNGGIWLQCLCKRLYQDGSLEDILTQVNKDVTIICDAHPGYMQQPIKYSTLHDVINLAKEGRVL